MRLISAICTFSATVMDTKVCATGRCGHARRQMGAAEAVMSGRPAPRAASGASCPPTMLKIVDLPAPLGR
jgi:hypothetical protein